MLAEFTFDDFEVSDILALYTTARLTTLSVVVSPF